MSKRFRTSEIKRFITSSIESVIVMCLYKQYKLLCSTCTIIDLFIDYVYHVLTAPDDEPKHEANVKQKSH